MSTNGFNLESNGGQVLGSVIPTVRSRIKTCFLVPAFSLLVITMIAVDASGQTAFSILQATGGISFTKVGSAYETTFGDMNALGIGTPQSGLTVAPLSNGALYFSEYQVQFTGLGLGNAELTAYVSTNFAHPAAQIIENCPSTSACTSSAGYSAMSTASGAPSTVIASMGVSTATVGIGIFLPDNDGASAFTGTDNSAVVTFTMTNVTFGITLATATMTFTLSPANTVQDAVSLALATAPSGLTVTGTSPYTMAFGNVNGLGVGATVPTVAAAGGIVYTTPYYLEPAFSDFTSTTAELEVYVSTNFAHPTLLQADDSAAAGGPYNAISTTVGSQTVITTTAADRSTITRYLGLFVSLNNTGTPFLGSDSATLTYTITVP